MNKKTVVIVGAGPVGSSAGYLLARAGYRITSVVSRTRASADEAAAFIGAGAPTTDAARAVSGAEIVLIATPDRVIKDVCEYISAGGMLKAGTLVAHLSGAHSLHLLDAAKAVGAYRAVVHPLQSVPGREQGVKNLPGSYFRIEADPEALETAKDLVKALGGIELAMPKWRSDKHSTALYHAGAVTVSNFFVALIDYGIKFYEALGAGKQEALNAVLPLIRGTLHNIETLGIPDALTGPIMRGDLQTVRDHLEAMQAKAPELLGLYKELAKQTISVARDKGSITGEVASELLSVLDDR
ncbi:MAG TPA: Rossmann-like and DUF2520 domain-containing protein [Nitrospirota bacterium]|nr:Rossmann-like and DUF2520 domain-containing protein [Nitrospirota bacterium]